MYSLLNLAFLLLDVSSAMVLVAAATTFLRPWQDSPSKPLINSAVIGTKAVVVGPVQWCGRSLFYVVPTGP